MLVRKVTKVTYYLNKPLKQHAAISLKLFYFVGPLVANIFGITTLVGVVSFGRHCVTWPYYGVYSRVTSHLEWILDNSDASKCQRWTEERRIFDYL